MKVLLTGSGGQVGQALLRSVPANTQLIGLSHTELDVADERVVSECVRLRKPDVIINAAAYTAVDRAEDEPEAARRANADGPRNLAKAARENKARLVHISTDFVFDGLSSAPYSPDSPTNPLGVYGVTKRGGEEGVLQELPGQSVILRTAWVYAAGGANFVRTMLRLMKANGSVRVVADQIGTPTAADSVAGVIWAVISRASLSGIHHWTDAGVASWYDFAVAIKEEAAQLGLVSPNVTVLPISTAEFPTRARRPRFSVLDKQSLTSIGIEPVHWRTRLRMVLGELARA